MPQAGGGLATSGQQGHKTMFVSIARDFFPAMSEEPAWGSGQVLGLVGPELLSPLVSPV